MVNNKTMCSSVTSVVNYLQKIIKNFITTTHPGWATLTFNYPHKIVKSQNN